MNTSATATKRYLGSFACPACESEKLLLTKEKIIICQKCLNGYKLMGDVPDFRLENAISFKKKLAGFKKGIKAIITVMDGKNKGESLNIKPGHCIILGRTRSMSHDDATSVGRLQDFKKFTPLPPESHQLIKNCLQSGLKTNTNQKIEKQNLVNQSGQFLGHYARDPDFSLEDSLISRSHAILYHGDDGVHLIDLVSKNGTYLNGAEIERTLLKNNDVISLGTASLRVQIS